jgi:membrane protein DedA with SNARE-associated domain
MDIIHILSIDNLGYLEIMLISFISSIIIFVPIPYVPVLIAGAFNTQLDPHIISILTTISVTTGRTIIFMISYYGYKILKEKTKKRLLPLQRLLSRYGWLGAFIAALTPFPPDDIIIILLGISKYNPFKFILASFAGKLIANEIIVWSTVILGKPFVERFIIGSSDPFYILIISIAVIIITILLIYLLLKINWSTIIGKWFPWTTNNDYD